ncbi:MAG TPA: helicase-related protein [Rectinemataceae bacterium]|nr:helicase-related protein [Rectinemataceae bacterium]
MNARSFTPGTLVRARGREWVVQPSVYAVGEALYLRPLGGADSDIQVILPELEASPIEAATFPLPDATKPGAYDSALLLRDALKLKLRAAAGPFRSFGRIAVEPRAYQLVPLLMALKQKTVRLLIADDVGIGKTIEAALIVRELLDRGEITRFAVLCPPHLVDQWVGELSERFHLPAVGLTASSVRRLESLVPRGLSLFEHFPALVMSLDYIKSEVHKNYFLSSAPELVVVDEAHTCTIAGQNRQRRYELLRSLVADPDRHLIMLTATPHSGDDVAFHNLLGLLDPEFSTLAGSSVRADDPLRQRLARHFVQRRRKDIDEWKDSSVFPRRMVKEITYTLSGDWGKFFESVRAYCLGLATEAEREKGEGARMMWYATLALLRCAASSPAAAHRALTARLEGTAEELAALADEERIGDGSADELGSNDQEPPAGIGDASLLEGLIAEADHLRGTEGDPKLAALVAHLESLSREKGKDWRPVVFCRYIATAGYVGEQIRKRLGDHTVDVITGELGPEEREERIDLLIQSKRPILIATDCLSEGINLQHGFNAVVHYDLAWNPTRHEQREGRVDRFGQKSREVRCAIIYGQDNPVDGFILDVILRKAQAIREELGVLVPMPEDGKRIQQALVKAALMKTRDRSGGGGQQAFDFGEALAAVDLKPMESAWEDAMQRAKANRTVFAQRRLRPEDVMPEWNKQASALGEANEVRRFVEAALIRLKAPLEALGKESFRFLPAQLPLSLKERMAAEGFAKPLSLGFTYPADTGSSFIHRSHPIVSLLADQVLESALSGDAAATEVLASRAAVFETASVRETTTIFLLRLRHQLDVVRAGKRRELMAEEAIALGIQGRKQPRFLPEADVEGLLDAHPSANLGKEVMVRELVESIAWFAEHRETFEKLAAERAGILLADHRRVRDAAGDTGLYSATACLPVDLIGVYVLLPNVI